MRDVTGPVLDSDIGCSETSPLSENPGLPQAAITKCHRPGGLSTKDLFFTVLEAKKSKMKVPAALVPGGGPPGLQVTIFSLCPHMVEREESSVLSSSYKGTNAIRGLHPHDFS